MNKCTAVKDCPNEGVYSRTNGYSDKLYWKCEQHNREYARRLMAKRYATSEGKEAQAKATKRWLSKKSNPES